MYYREIVLKIYLMSNPQNIVKITLIVDAGNSPIPQYTKDYQAGCLSFEIISNQK